MKTVGILVRILEVLTHKDVTYILQEEILHFTQPYIDDVPVRGPATRYLQENGEPEMIPENPVIRLEIA